jgi:hypothetical protein
MFAVTAATMDVSVTTGAIMAEMITRVVVPSMVVTLIPIGTIIAPISVNEGPVIAVIVTVVIVRGWNCGTDAHADADTADMDSDPNLGIRGCCTN